MTQKEIADKFYCSKTTICKWFKKYNIDTNRISRNKFTEKETKIIIDMHEKDKNTYEIAEKLNSYPTSISRVLKRNG